MKPWNRQKLNFIIDMLMFVFMLILAILGFLIKYILIPASERWVKYGQNVELTSLGLDRHEWSKIHLFTGILLCILLMLHIIFHWHQIISFGKKFLPHPKIRIALVVILFLICSGIILAPFYLPVEIGTSLKGGEHFVSDTEITEKNNRVTEKEIISEVQKLEKKIDGDHSSPEEHRTLEIRGTQTITEISQTYKIPTEELKKALKIPLEVSNNERLGRIRRTYGFTMHEVEESVLTLQKNN